MKYIVILVTLISMTVVAKSYRKVEKRRVTKNTHVIKQTHTMKKPTSIKKGVSKKVIQKRVINPSLSTTHTAANLGKAHAFTLMNQKRRFNSLKKILTKTKKKYIFLTFFTNSCKVCPRERAQLKALSAKYNNFDVIYIASRIGKDEEVTDFMNNVKATIKKERIGDVLLDVYDVVAKFYGVKKLNAINVPRLFIIEVKSGNIVKDIKGYHADLETTLKNDSILK